MKTILLNIIIFIKYKIIFNIYNIKNMMIMPIKQNYNHYYCSYFYGLLFTRCKCFLSLGF